MFSWNFLNRKVLFESSLWIEQSYVISSNMKISEDPNTKLWWFLEPKSWNTIVIFEQQKVPNEHACCFMMSSRCINFLSLDRGVLSCLCYLLEGLCCLSIPKVNFLWEDPGSSISYSPGWSDHLITLKKIRFNYGQIPFIFTFTHRFFTSYYVNIMWHAI